MQLFPSMMCADFDRLGEDVEELIAAGADGFHLDVMDGHFVPNFGLGLGDVQCICRHAKAHNVPCDVHLMAEDADILPELFVKAGVDIVYVHPEGERTVNSTLQKIARLGAHPGIAVDPGLSLEALKYTLPAVDYVLIMTVNPGFAGQKYLDYVTSKIADFAAVKEEYGFKIFVDGACSPEVIKKVGELGADGAILGTSALFGKDRGYSELLSELHATC